MENQIINIAGLIGASGILTYIMRGLFVYLDSKLKMKKEIKRGIFAVICFIVAFIIKKIVPQIDIVEIATALFMGGTLANDALKANYEIPVTVPVLETKVDLREQTIQEVMAEIKNIESNGNYGALGVIIKSGMYKGDRAYGAFQIMGKNITPWSKEVLGYTVTKEAFLNSPETQDKIAHDKLGESYDKHNGSKVDMKSIWFTGRPYAEAVKRNAKDQLGTTVQEYVR